MAREFKPGMVPCAPRPQKACCYTTEFNGQRWRCTDASPEGQLLCALHLKERNDKLAAEKKAREKKVKSWWPFGS